MFSKTTKLLILTICFVFAASVCHASEEKLRVGYVPIVNYSETAPDGSVTGYEAEYLHAVAQHTDWKYEFISLSNVDEGLELLRRNKIDIMGGVKPTPARRRDMLFSRKPCALDKSALIVADNDQRYGYEAYYTFNGMRVGYISRESGRALDLLSFAKEKKLFITVKSYPDGEGLFAALRNGEIDAIVVSGLYNLSTDYRVVMRSDDIPLYFAVNKDDGRIIREFDRAVDKILQIDPYFNINLYTKHYSSDFVRPEFTQAEKDFIKEGKEFVVVYDPELPPIEYRDRQTGEFSGYSARVFRKISEKSGLKFRYIPSFSLQEDQDFFRKGTGFDIYATFSYDYAWAEQHLMRITRPYISRVPAVLISKNREQSEYAGKKIALIKNYFYPGKIRDRFPECEPVYLSTVEQCLDAVLKGTADFAGASLYDAEFHFTNNKKYSSLYFRNIPDLFYEYGIGVSRNADKRLFSIVSKALNSFTEEDNKEVFLINWNLRSKNGWYYIKRNSETFTVFILFVISLVAVFVMFDGLFLHRRVIKNLIRAKKNKKHRKI